MALSLPLFSTTAALTCMEPKRKITIEIKTDSYGADTSWEFKVQNGRVLATNDRVYGSNEIDTTEICIKKGKLYEFTVRDKYGDGMCCHYGNGSYKIKTESSRTEDGEEIILHGGRFQEKEMTHLINTTSPLMSDRDHLWLEAHNIRRKLWHNHYNTEYVPLQYSESLVAEAQIWAEFLLDSCKDGMYHDPARVYGENVASNAGMGTWAEQRTPDQVLARFVEDEVDDPWPANGHLTQALWRASR